MIYYSNKARKTAINNIEKLVGTIMKMKTSELAFSDAMEICYYLNTLKDEIKKEKTDEQF